MTTYIIWMQNQILVKCFFGKTPCSYIFLVNMSEQVINKENVAKNCEYTDFRPSVPLRLFLVY